MLSLQEHKQIAEAVDILNENITDELIEQTDYFDVEEDPVTLQTEVTLYNSNKELIKKIVVEEYDVALTYLEEVFDIDWDGDEN